jgi:hypothetical protein
MRLLDAAVALAVFTAAFPLLYWTAGPSPDRPTRFTVLQLKSQDRFMDADGASTQATLRVECDGDERAEVVVNGVVAGGRPEVERVLRGDQVRLGGAAFRGEGPALEAARRILSPIHSKSLAPRQRRRTARIFESW